MSLQGSEAMQVLEPFHPLLRQWFLERYRVPTDVQIQAWPIISASRNVLVIAPTGSGKTLCAFLWSIHQLVSGVWPAGGTRVLYVSPLKALNNDIQRNLQQPLRELYGLFTRENERFPEIRVLTRSGDTPERERQQMIRRPPDILITTPESLNLLLSSPRARNIFQGLRTVILDEIHAVASSKRGTHLMTAVERLVPLAGEFQRIALSATVNPPDRVAAFVGGYRLQRHEGEVRYLPRPVEVVQSFSSKSLELSVRFPAAGTRRAPGSEDRGDKTATSGSDSQGGPNAESSTVTAPKSRPSPGPGTVRGWEDPFWEPFVNECLERIRTNRSTLIFTNTRRHAEKVAWLINERAGEPLAYAHHGSLSREIRTVVERKLKRGELSAIVATSSLELGIDIGELDEVLLLQTPFTVASALQRIGRAGHAVGEVSRGRLYATHGRDLLNAAVMAVQVRRRSIERVRLVECPLDVLAQVILSMTGIEPWDIDELYDCIRTSSPYRHLSRRHFDLVLDMLSGRYADTRLRELEPRVLLDRPGNIVRGRGAALPLVYRSGGTIPDRGLYELRLRDAGARIGELDEEFVWERKEGDTFNLGTQNWKITRIDERSVEVVPWSGPVGITPFWREEKGARDFSFCEAVGLFLEQADARLADEDLTAWLQGELQLEEEAAGALGSFLRRQKHATGTGLPHRRHLLVEHLGGPLYQAGLRRIVLHTLWGGRVNEPLALALSAAWERRHGGTAAESLPTPEFFADDDCLMIVFPKRETTSPDGLDVGELLDLVTRGGGGTAPGIEELLRLRLESSGFFGARFRENAGRALLLPRSDFRRRVPLWLTRLRSKSLLSAIRRYSDFPLLLETWRSCLNDDFDLDTLERLLGELGRGEIRISEVRTVVPSPFAENISWIQTNQHTYEGDVTGGGASRVPGGLIRELLQAPHLRPRIDPALVRELTQKLQRTARGYGPSDALELWDWVRERLFVPVGEWRGLLEAMRRDHGLDSAELLPALEERLVCCRLPDAAAWGVCARETLPRLLEALCPGAWRLGPEAHGGRETAFVETVPLGDVQEDVVAQPNRISQAKGGQTDVTASPVREPPIPGAGQPRWSLLPILRGAPSGREGAPSWDPTAAIGEWLRYYGPVEPRMIGELLGISNAGIERAIESLVEGGLAVYDVLTTDAAEPQICDVENLEILLRQARRARRPEVRARPLEELPLFLALRQGILSADADSQHSAPGVHETIWNSPSEEGAREALQGYLDKLFGYPATAELWEGEIFPARRFPYYGRWLDALLRDTGLLWFGCGRGRVAFCLASDFELFREARSPEKPSEQDTPLALLGSGGSYGTWDLAERSGLSTGELTREIWRRVWDGELTGEGFEVLRRGLRSGFRADLLSGGSEGKDRLAGSGRRRSMRGSRSSFDRWRLSRPLEARWSVLEDPVTVDLVEEEELRRDRVRQLLDRYGVLFRELLQRELPLLRWAQVFRTLRVMELSGEVLSGYFFESIPGLQFLAPDALAFMRRTHPLQDRPEDLEIDVPEIDTLTEPRNQAPQRDRLPGSQFPGERVYWMNAADPASPCGLGLELPHLPARSPSNHLVYCGSRLVLVSSRRGRNLEFFGPPEDARIGEYLGFLRVLTRREWRPLNSLRVETINAIPARDSPYKAALLSFGFVEEFRGLVLRAAP